VALVAYAAADLLSPDERVARLAYQSQRPVQLYVNGVEVATAELVAHSALKVNPTWSRTGPVALRAGLNHVLVVSPHGVDDNPWQWFLHLMVEGEDGLPAPEVAVVPPEGVLQ
jgi:hypothetical protein